MAWGWETANIGQSKLSWVLLGFGEWKADKASPHALGCTRLEESQEDGTGGRGGLLRFPPSPRGYVHVVGLICCVYTSGNSTKNLVTSQLRSWLNPPHTGAGGPQRR